MRFNSKDIADLVDGLLFGENLELVGVSSLENPKERTLIFCPSERDVERVKDVKDTTLVVPNPVEHPSYILVKDTKLALAIVLEKLYPEEHPTGISEKAHVESSAVLGEDVYVGPFAYIGKNVVLERGVKVYPFSYIGDHSFVGENTVIFSGVHVYPRTVIGKNVRIHSGAVIGADGFGYHITKEGIIKLNHIGNVVIEDNVEIGANTTIDRALLDSTVVGRETKIDNLVMVAHNCRLGERNIILGQAGLAGSVKTGRNVILAAQVGVADHVSIGDNVQVAAKSGVSKNLEPNKTYGANLPAVEWSRWKRIYVYLLKLPELFKK